MEPQLAIEAIPFVWGVMFTMDVMAGILLFFAVLSDAVPKEFNKVSWFLGWLYWLDAITLLINATLGPTNPFSYHQFGIVTGMLMDSVVLVFLVWFLSVGGKNESK